MKKDAMAAAPTKSQVENWAISGPDFNVASSIEETIAFSVFSLASLDHSFKGSVED